MLWSQKKNQPWVTNNFRHLYEQRRVLEKGRAAPKAATKYRMVNRDIRKGMNAARENWTVEQCGT